MPMTDVTNNSYSSLKLGCGFEVFLNTAALKVVIATTNNVTWHEDKIYPPYTWPGNVLISWFSFHGLLSVHTL